MTECIKKFINLLQKWRNVSPKSKLLLSLIAIVIYWIIYFVFINYLKGSSNDLISLLNTILQFIPVIWVAYVFVDFTYHRYEELKFRDGLSGLIQEMITNTERLTKDSIDGQIQKIPLKIKNGNWAGFDKWPSFTNWASDSTNFYLKYLPTTNYYYFISQGFFNSKFANKLDDGIKEIVAKNYFKYIKISIAIQNFENNELGWNRSLPEKYDEKYYSIIEAGQKIYLTQDFMGESFNVIKKIVEKYPEIQKGSELESLKEKLHFNN